MKVELDARTLEAIRVFLAPDDGHNIDTVNESVATLRAFVAASEAALHEQRDDALAWEIVVASKSTCGETFESYKARWPNLWKNNVAAARAARAFIAKEQP